MNLCKYKNVLGIPGKGIHSYRFFTPFSHLKRLFYKLKYL